MLSEFQCTIRAGNHIHSLYTDASLRIEPIPPGVDVRGHPLFASCARRGAMDGQERRAPI